MTGLGGEALAGLPADVGQLLSAAPVTDKKLLELSVTWSGLPPGEARMAEDRNLEPRPQARAWEYWCTRLRKAGEYPAGAPKAASARKGGKTRAAKSKKRR